MSAWSGVGAVAADSLTEGRLQIHHAVQLLAGFGQTFVRPRSDDSHRSTTWDGRWRAVRSEESDDGYRLALRPDALSLFLLHRGAPTGVELGLPGRTLEEAGDWLVASLGRITGSARVLEWPEYDLPEHPVAQGSAFPEGALAERSELTRWIDNAAGLLWRLAFRSGVASPVRFWPHHLDLATLLSVGPGTDADDAAKGSVGVGLALGDDDYAEPYWYVAPHPRPDVQGLPEPPGGGHWHTDGFTALVLTGSTVVAAGGADAQRALSQKFLERAVSAARTLLGGS